MDPKIVAKYLKGLPFFSYLSPAECLDIVRCCSTQTFKQGEVIFREGEASQSLYVVERGALGVEKNTLQGFPSGLAKIEAGAVVGEMALLDQAPRSATVAALVETYTYRVDFASFMSLRANLAPAAAKVVRYLAIQLCERLRRIHGQIEQIYLDPAQSLRMFEQRHQEIVSRVTKKLDPAQLPPTAARSRRPEPSQPFSSPREYDPGTGGKISEALLDFVSQVPLLHGMSLEERRVLCGILRAEHCASEQVICQEGDARSRLLILCKGRVDMKKDVKGGKPVQLATLAPPALIGEVSMIDGGRSATTCVAKVDTALLCCTKPDFDRLFQAQSPFALRFVDRLAVELSRRVREANDQLITILSRPGQTIQELRARLEEVQGRLEGQESGELPQD